MNDGKILKWKDMSPCFSGWISVKDSLPDRLERVLVTDGDRLYVAWLEDSPNGHWDISHCCGCTTSGEVTHWLRLPPPPWGINDDYELQG